MQAGNLEERYSFLVSTLRWARRFGNVRGYYFLNATQAPIKGLIPFPPQEAHRAGGVLRRDCHT